jgi:hypothetical protein
MAGGTRYEENEGFWGDLGFMPGVVSLVDRASGTVARRARSSAPVVTGRYRSGIVEQVHSTEHRYVKRVVATAESSMGVESRTGNLARALRGVRVY